MFDDARFYSRLAEDSKSYGHAKCSDSTMFLAIGKLDFENDLLDVLERGDDFLIDESGKLAA